LLCQSQHEHTSRWFVCWFSLGVSYETTSRWHWFHCDQSYPAVGLQLTNWDGTDISTRSSRVELPEMLKWVGLGTTCVSTKLCRKLDNLLKSGWWWLQKSILKSPRSIKLEKTPTSKLSKIEYKSSNAAKLAGGRYHKPIYTFSLTLFVLCTDHNSEMAYQSWALLGFLPEKPHQPLTLGFPKREFRKKQVVKRSFQSS